MAVGEERSEDGGDEGFIVLGGTEEHQGLHEDACGHGLRRFSTRADPPLSSQQAVWLGSPLHGFQDKKNILQKQEKLLIVLEP